MRGHNLQLESPKTYLEGKDAIHNQNDLKHTQNDRTWSMTL